MLLLNTLSIIIGYLLGSIPTAYIVSRLRKGVDIRNIGSRNMGGANVMREIGTREGVLVGLFDVAKGAAAILIAQALNVPQPWVFGAGFAALVGHNFPVFAGFRGGRGAAVIIGILLVLAPAPMLVTLVVIAIPFFASRKFGGAIIIGFALLPLFVWLFEGSIELVRYVLALDLFMLVRNVFDIKRVVSKGIIRDMISERNGKEGK
jgi:acyl phosphate:glycerol-3-phosphate acyltransferase